MRSRYEQIHELAREYSISELCFILEVARSGYYAWVRQVQSDRAVMNSVLTIQIEQVFLKHRRRYGSPRVTNELRQAGYRCNHKRVERLMRERGLKARPHRRWRPCTTNSNHPNPIAPNLLTEMKTPTAVNQVWVSDITYVPTAEGWLYLAGIMDLYSRRIIGWSVKETLGSELPLEALNRALAQRTRKPGLIHHSDRGCQYSCEAYRQALNQNDILPSMSGRGNCYDNAAMESFWSTLKIELPELSKQLSKAEVRRTLFEYIEAYYNRERIHSSLDFKSPVEFETN